MAEKSMIALLLRRRLLHNALSERASDGKEKDEEVE